MDLKDCGKLLICADESFDYPDGSIKLSSFSALPDDEPEEDTGKEDA